MCTVYRLHSYVTYRLSRVSYIRRYYYAVHSMVSSFLFDKLFSRGIRPYLLSLYLHIMFSCFLRGMLRKFLLENGRRINVTLIYMLPWWDKTSYYGNYTTSVRKKNCFSQTIYGRTKIQFDHVNINFLLRLEFF